MVLPPPGCAAAPFVLSMAGTCSAWGVVRGAGGGDSSAMGSRGVGLLGAPRLMPGLAIHLPHPSWSSSSLSLCPMSGGMGLPPIRVPIPAIGGADGSFPGISCGVALSWLSRSLGSSGDRLLDFHASTRMKRPNRIMPGHSIFSGRLWISSRWKPSLTL